MFLMRRFRKSQWLWLLFLFYVAMLSYYLVYKKDFNLPVNEVQLEDILHKVNELVTELKEASHMNSKLAILLDVEERKYTALSNQNKDLQKQKIAKREPTQRYEELLRRIKKTAQNFVGFLLSEGHTLNLISYYNGHVREHRRSLLTDCDRLKHFDGYDNWRHVESKELSTLVQKKINSLRNPLNCDGKKLIIEKIPEENCEFACQIHFLVNSLALAYGTKRAIAISNKSSWKYFNDGFEKYFGPISGSCGMDQLASNVSWPGNHQNEKVLMLTKESLETTLDFIPAFLPSDLSSRIVRIHGEPAAWWTSEFLKNILQFNVKTLRMIDGALNSLNLTRPFVGVHVKRNELNKQPLGVYLDAVDDYYRRLEQSGQVFKRRIYLATDDPKIILEALMLFPQFEILSNSLGAELVFNPKTRDSKGALDAIVLDMHILSISDFLICSFTSEICRLSYELMQTLHRDASDRVHSIDSMYYYHYKYNHFEVYRSHEKRYENETNAYVGTLLEIPIQQPSAHSFLVTKDEGSVKTVIPAFKTKKIAMTKDFDLLQRKYS